MSSIAQTSKGLYKGSTYIQIATAIKRAEEVKRFAQDQEIIFYVNCLLRSKYSKLVAMSEQLIYCEGSGQFTSLVPFNQDEQALFIKQADTLFPENVQYSIINALLPTLAKKLNKKNKSWVFNEYINMLQRFVSSIVNTVISSSGFDLVADNEEKYQVYDYLETVQAIHAFQQVKSALILSLKSVEKEQSQKFQLGVLFERFILEKAGSTRKDTVGAYRTKFKDFFELFPETFDGRKFAKNEMLEIKQSMINKNNSRQLKEKLGSKTMNGYLSNYRTFFSWCVEHVDEIDKNPFSNVKFASDGRELKRRAFSEVEVRAQLNYEFKRRNEARYFRDDAKWALSISLYTGMRLNEMCSLPLSAVKLIDGVHCFDLRAVEVKNESSSRVIPIAQYLIDNGLLDKVEKLRKERRTYLFTQIRGKKRRAPANGWGDCISKWFTRNLLKNIGIDKEAETKNGISVVFHCNRKTMISKCVKGGAQVHLIKRLVGHSLEDDVTLTVYSDVKDIPLKLLKEVLDEHLDWHL